MRVVLRKGQEALAIAPSMVLQDLWHNLPGALEVDNGGPSVVDLGRRIRVSATEKPNPDTVEDR